MLRKATILARGVPPPASRYARVDNGTLVAPDQQSTGFPRIPGVNYSGRPNASGEMDFGSGVRGNRGVIENLRPSVLSVHRLLVPRVDGFGNDIGGLRSPVVRIPVATVTGWNLRRPEFGESDLCDASGMMIPLKNTRQERIAAGDPQPSLEEIYGDAAGYVGRIALTAANLYSERLMLIEDVYRVIEEAMASSVLR